MNCVNISCFGTDCKVVSSTGKTITERKVSIPLLFNVVFPNLEKFHNYKIVGNVKVVDIQLVPLQEIFIQLPNPQKKEPEGGSDIHKFEYKPTWHSPASIDIKQKRVIYNKKFKDASFSEQIFILEHERGHFYYRTEKFCDLYALNALINKGFGISQAFLTLETFLIDSPEKKERINYCFAQVNKALQK